MFGKHTLDAGFGQFFNILEWSAWKNDSYFAMVNKDYTSQVCPNCDAHTGKKELNFYLPVGQLTSFSNPI